MTDILRIDSDPRHIVQPPCLKCGTPMELTRIEPEEPGIDRRTFECTRCQHIEAILVSFA